MLFAQRPSVDPNQVSFAALSGGEGGAKKGKPKLSFAEDFILGGVAAGISKTAAAPIERVKLLLQNQDEMLKKGTLDKAYTGIMDCSRRVIAEEGFVSFWRGNLANVIRYFPTQALNFAFNKQIKAVFNQTVEKNGYFMWFLSNMASGGIAGALSLTFVYSLDFARTRLANDLKSSKKGAAERQYKGLIDVYTKTIKSDGVGGLYRGFVISCIGIVAYRGCYFGFFDTLKPLVLGDSNSFILQFLLGWVVTIVASMASYPLDTIRRRMMMTSGEAVKYKGSMDCAVKIMQAEGWKSFFKGAGANVIRGVAGAGVLSGFEKIQEFYVAFRTN